MNKKDRIAIVASIIYFIFPLFVLVSGDGEAFIVFSIPLIFYWGYRFVKNDISFLKTKGED